MVFDHYRVSVSVRSHSQAKGSSTRMVTGALHEIAGHRGGRQFSSVRILYPADHHRSLELPFTHLGDSPQLSQIYLILADRIVQGTAHGGRSAHPACSQHPCPNPKALPIMPERADVSPHWNGDACTPECWVETCFQPTGQIPVSDTFPVLQKLETYISSVFDKPATYSFTFQGLTGNL
jgi:hypothetical protein